jgi:hypothetical protein
MIASRRRGKKEGLNHRDAEGAEKRYMHEKFDKQKLLALIQVEYEFVERTLALISPERMLETDVQGSWSAKDTIAHLTAWERRLCGWLSQAIWGEQPTIPEPGCTWSDVDAINERIRKIKTGLWAMYWPIFVIRINRC